MEQDGTGWKYENNDSAISHALFKIMLLQQHMEWWELEKKS